MSSFKVGPPPDNKDPRFLQWMTLLWKYIRDYVATIASTVWGVSQGGTGLSSGTSGGIPGYTSATTMASSVLLTQNAIVLGGGAGATPTPLGSLGTTTTILHGNASGAPTWAAVNMATDMTGTMAAAQFPALTGDVTTSAGSLATTAVMQRDITRFGFPGAVGATTQDDATGTTISFDGATTFTLAPKSPATTWTYYRSGIKYTITGSKTATIPAGTATTTMYFIYIDATDGTLSVSTSSWTLNDTKVPVATLVRNSGLTPSYVMAEERHTVLIDRRTHYEHHFTEGTQMQTVGALSGYTLNSSTDGQKTFAIADSILLDEDIIETLASLTQPNGTNTDYFVAYRTASSAWAWKASSMPFIYNVGNTNNVIQYDNAGTITDTGIGLGVNKRWANSYLCMSNMNGTPRHFIVPGRSQFTTLALAQAEDPSTFTFTNFITAEFRIVYQLSWAVISGAGTGQCQLAATPKVVTVSAIQTSSSGGSIQHNTLSGLDGGTTGEYYHLTAAQYSALGSSSTLFSFAAAHG